MKNSLVFTSGLDSLQNVAIDMNSAGQLGDDELKKQARIKLSLMHTSAKLGFMHACLLQINGRVYALAGKSGVGKSTIAALLAKQNGVQILANDWIAVEKDTGNLFASDLNFASKAPFKKYPLAGILFIDMADAHQRDAYTPLVPELTAMLGTVFDDMPSKSKKILSAFWLNAYSMLELCCIIPRYQHTAEQLLKIIQHVIENSAHFHGGDPPELPPIRVGVVGSGRIGSALAFRLTQLRNVTEIMLLDRNQHRAQGIALDLHQAYPLHGTKVKATKSISTLLNNVDVLFFCFRDSHIATSLGTDINPYEQRHLRLKSHTLAIKKYAKAISNHGFKGTIFVITNPTDALAATLYQEIKRMDNKPLYSHQVYAIGLEIDYCRALEAAKKHHLSSKKVEVHGGHSTQLFVTVDGKPNKEVQYETEQGSLTIQQYQHSSLYGPVEAAVRNLECFLSNHCTHVATIAGDQVVGGKITFKSGIPSMYDGSA